MTLVSEQEFLKKLLEVVAKLLSIAKAQGLRFKKLWDDLLIEFNDKPHNVRSTALNQERFLNDINYRIEILKILDLSQIDGFYSIKSVLETLYFLEGSIRYVEYAVCIGMAAGWQGFTLTVKGHRILNKVNSIITKVFFKEGVIS